MKISYNWLQQHLTYVPETSALDSLLTQLGLEVEGVTASGITPDQLQGLLVGEVMECEQHPTADKLRITKVNIGSEPLLSIVCGAPNVIAGQKVVVATIGTTLYPASGESFKIKKSKIRGEESQGMLCAEDEIGLETSHAGIIVLPAETAAAQSFFFKRSIQTPIEESFFLRSAATGDSPMPMTSLASRRTILPPKTLCLFNSRLRAAV